MDWVAATVGVVGGGAFGTVSTWLLSLRYIPAAISKQLDVEQQKAQTEIKRWEREQEEKRNAPRVEHVSRAIELYLEAYAFINSLAEEARKPRFFERAHDLSNRFMEMSNSLVATQFLSHEDLIKTTDAYASFAMLHADIIANDGVDSQRPPPHQMEAHNKLNEAIQALFTAREQM